MILSLTFVINFNQSQATDIKVSAITNTHVFRKYCLILILMFLEEAECQIQIQVPMDFLTLDNPYLTVNVGLLERVF